MKIKILRDAEGIYQANQVMHARTLINDFIDCLTDNADDSELIKWLNSVSEKSAVKWIANLWDLSVEFK